MSKKPKRFVRFVILSSDKSSERNSPGSCQAVSSYQMVKSVQGRSLAPWSIEPLQFIRFAIQCALCSLLCGLFTRHVFKVFQITEKTTKNDLDSETFGRRYLRLSGISICYFLQLKNDKQNCVFLPQQKTGQCKFKSLACLN